MVRLYKDTHTHMHLLHGVCVGIQAAAYSDVNRRLTLNKHITPTGAFPGTSHGQLCASSCFRSHDSSTRANVTISEEQVKLSITSRESGL